MRSVPRKKPGQGCGQRRFTGALLDVTGAADLLGTTPACVRARIARHRLPCRKDHGRIVFLRSELEEFVASLPVICSVEEALAHTEEQP
jgi:hypothetical protein